MADEISCIMVLGMHRSGTSLSAAMIRALGIEAIPPTESYLPADPSNAAGYWEPAGLVRLNDEILRSWGGHYMDPRIRARPHTIRDLPPALRQSMVDYAREWRDAGKVFMWKDPRLSVTFPLWRQVLGEIAIVWCVRDPVEVGQSLRKRDGLPACGGTALWEVYNRAIAVQCGASPVKILLYESLVRDGPRSVRALAEFLTVTMGSLDLDVARALEQIDPAKRHHDRSAPSAEAEEAPTESQASLFRDLQAGRVPEAGGCVLYPEACVTDLIGGYGTMRTTLTEELKSARRREESWKQDYMRLRSAFPVNFMLWVRRAVSGADVGGRSGSEGP